MTTIAQHSQVIITQIADAARGAGRQPSAVTLVAVSKTHSSALVREAYMAGLRDFGENYVQEALDKQASLKELPITWHFIGPIQSNKTRLIAENFAWVHGVDRLKIAQRLSEARLEGLPPLNVCVQVNISGEDSKSGCALNEVAALARAVAVLPGLKLRGLMAIPEPTTNVTLQRQRFRMLHDLMVALNADGLKLDTLSMGMSHDFAAAIMEGATMVRIGTAIFGERTYSEH